jgi:photosystem II stability/assembly factor-like uncharacterized protein
MISRNRSCFAGAISFGRTASLGTLLLFAATFLLVASVLWPHTASAQTLNDDSLKGMKWRLVGPFRGGRVLAVTGIASEPNTYYFGAVAGGVWKTTDGGVSWLPIFDHEKISSIGAIAAAPSDPNVLYVGTGESCIRGDISYGDGMYKSTDAGKSWTHIGLEDTQHIARIIVDPRNPDIVLVAALGHAYGPNAERGVFRSTDGGKSWQKVLYQDDKTGAIDLSFDPQNSHVVFAALWQASRSPWGLYSGGPGSALYKSSDGGATWKKLEGHGLPKGVLGRIGVSVSGADSNRVYALIEAAENGGLYRSDDAGDTWHHVTDDHRFTQRAWYFDHIFADPKSADTLYILNTGMYRSIDGGNSFNSISAPHGDRHGLWIDPENPKRMIESDDGGATITTDGGKNWTTQNNQPTAEFYHVDTDNQFLYRVYGAQQDNSTVSIASRSDNGSIAPSDFYDVAGGESGFVVPDPRNPDIVYAGSYDGLITRFDKSTGQAQDVSAWPLNPMGHGAAELVHRFQWTAPIALSPSDPNVLYHGAEVLFKSTDQGMSWTAISPDLTRNDKSKQQSAGGPITQDNTSVEYYDTIFAIAESPLDKNQIWVGTDDGLVQLTRDGGKNWSNVTPKEIGDWSEISIIEPSPYDAGTAYVSVDRHRLDDHKPYIFKTSDFGKTWKALASNLPANSFVHVVREDPLRRGMLYAGTEMGVWVSFDDGARWQPLQLNLPVSPVHDLAIHNDDLIAATHGRAFWILDDILPLREWADVGAALAPKAPESKPADVTTSESKKGESKKTKKAEPKATDSATANSKTADSKAAAADSGSAQAESVHFFKPRVAYRTGAGSRPIPPGVALGQNPPDGAILDYWLESEPKDPKETISLEILDAKGTVVRKFTSKKTDEEKGPDEGDDFPRRGGEPLPAEKGLNRFVWDLRYERATRVPKLVTWGGSGQGPVAVPGTYQARLRVGGKDYTVSFDVKEDPRVHATQADLEKQLDLALKIRASINETHEAVNQATELRAQLEALHKRLGGNGSAGDDKKAAAGSAPADPGAKANSELAAALEDLRKKFGAFQESLVQLKSKTGEDPLNFPIQIADQMVALESTVEGSDAAPTAQCYTVFDMLSKQIAGPLAQWKDLRDKDLAALNQKIADAKIPAISLAPEKKDEAAK